MKSMLYGLLTLAKPLFIYIQVVGGKMVKMGFLIAVTLFGFAAVGLLPRSPFRLLNTFIASGYDTWIGYFLPFIPIVEMAAVLSLWVSAIVVWYSVKVALRLARIIS